jgi:predicted TIM-barrel fold metal-dependent hydrolase
MRIDVHAHYYPHDYVRLLVKLGRTDLNPQAGQPADFASRIEQLDAAGVECQVLSAIGMDTLIAERDGAREAARFVNDAYKEVMQKYPGRFQAWGWVPLPYVDAAIEEAVRCLDDLHFVGIGLACAYQQRTLDDPEFEAFWQELNRRRAVVYVHPVGAHSRCHWGTDKYTLDILCGSPTQETIAASRLVYSGVTQLFPDIAFVFAGCGGTLPFLYPIHEALLKNAYTGFSLQRWARDAPLDPSDPMAEFRRFYYDTSTQDAPLALLCAKQAFGADRLMLGSDAVHGSVVRAVEYVRDSEYLTSDEKTAILDRTAQAVLKLPLAP